MKERRIFLVLTKVVPIAFDIEWLDLPYIEDTNELVIVGLLAIQLYRIYIADVSKWNGRQKRGY